MNHSEEVLWRSFRQGDSAAFKQLYEQYSRLLFAYCFKISAEEALIEDCIHDLFLDLWQQRANLGETTSVTFYLLSAAKRRLIRMMQLREKNKNAFDVSASNEDIALSFEDVLIENEHTEYRNAQLLKHIEKLSKAQKEVIFLKYFANLSHQEIAKLMDINYQSVSNLLSSALKRLRENWVQILFVCHFFLEKVA